MSFELMRSDYDLWFDQVFLPSDTHSDVLAVFNQFLLRDDFSAAAAGPLYTFLSALRFPAPGLSALHTLLFPPSHSDVFIQASPEFAYVVSVKPHGTFRVSSSGDIAVRHQGQHRGYYSPPLCPFVISRDTSLLYSELRWVPSSDPYFQIIPLEPLL
jgi:hypothetical protein